MKGKLTNHRTKTVTRTSRDYLEASFETPHGTVTIDTWIDGRWRVTERVEGGGEVLRASGVIGLDDASLL